MFEKLISFLRKLVSFQSIFSKQAQQMNALVCIPNTLFVFRIHFSYSKCTFEICNTHFACQYTFVYRTFDLNSPPLN